MVKTIKIGERDVRFDTSLAWMFKYRTQFGHDPIDVIMPAIKAAIPLVEIEGGKLTIADLDLLTDILGELNFTEALQLIWALAANGDKEIDDPATWYAGFEFFPLDDVLTEIAPAVFESCISSKKNQGTVGEDEIGSAGEFEITLESILQGGLMRGLRMADTETMTLGMWVDYVIEWNNIHISEQLPEKKRATQADFDAF